MRGEAGEHSGNPAGDRHTVVRGDLFDEGLIGQIGSVERFKEPQTGADASGVQIRGQKFERRVTGSGSEPACRHIDDGGTGLDRHEGVGDGESEVVVRMETDFNFETVHESADPLAHVRRRVGAGGIHEDDRVGAVSLHEQRLLEQLLGGRHVAHHEDALHHNIHLAEKGDLLARHIGLGAVGSHSDLVDPTLERRFEIAFHGGEPRYRQDSEPRLVEFAACRLQHLGIAQCCSTDLYRRGTKSVSVPHFDDVDSCSLRSAGVRANIVGAELMGNGVVAIPEGEITDRDLTLRAHDFT